MWVFNNSGYFRRLWRVFELNVFLRRQGVDPSVQVMPVVVPSLILLHTVRWFVFYSLFEILWETWTQTLSRAVRFGETWWWLVIFVPIVWDAICHAKGWDFDAFVVSGVVQIWANKTWGWRGDWAVCNHSGHRDILCPCILHGFYSTITCWWTVSCIPQITPFATSEVPGKRRLGTGSCCCRRFPFIGWSAWKGWLSYDFRQVYWKPHLDRRLQSMYLCHFEMCSGSISTMQSATVAPSTIYIPRQENTSLAIVNWFARPSHKPMETEVILEKKRSKHSTAQSETNLQTEYWLPGVANKAAKLRWRFKNRQGTLGRLCVIICQARWGGVFFERSDKRSEHFRKLWYNNSKFLLHYVDVVCCCFQTEQTKSILNNVIICLIRTPWLRLCPLRLYVNVVFSVPISFLTPRISGISGKMPEAPSTAEAMLVVVNELLFLGREFPSAIVLPLGLRIWKHKKHERYPNLRKSCQGLGLVFQTVCFWLFQLWPFGFFSFTPAILLVVLPISTSTARSLKARQAMQEPFLHLFLSKRWKLQVLEDPMVQVSSF